MVFVPMQDEQLTQQAICLLLVVPALAIAPILWDTAAAACAHHAVPLLACALLRFVGSGIGAVLIRFLSIACIVGGAFYVRSRGG